MDPRKIKPPDGWILVLADQRKEKKSSGIIIPETSTTEKLTQGSGVIIRTGFRVDGSTRKNELMGIKDGDRVAFRSFLKAANPVESEETWPNGSKKEFFLMSSDDLLGVVADGVEIGVFSDRPATHSLPAPKPEKKS